MLVFVPNHLGGNALLVTEAGDFDIFYGLSPRLLVLDALERRPFASNEIAQGRAAIARLVPFAHYNGSGSRIAVCFGNAVGIAVRPVLSHHGANGKDDIFFRQRKPLDTGTCSRSLGILYLGPHGD